MRLTQDDSELDELSLLDSAPRTFLQGARTKLGDLTYAEDRLEASLTRLIREEKEIPELCMAYDGLLAESRERRKLLDKVHRILKDALRDSFQRVPSKK